MSRFPQRLDNKPHLDRGESAALVGKPVALQSLHQLGLQADPIHEFLAGSSLGHIRGVELGQLAFSIGTYLKGSVDNPSSYFP